LGQFAAAEQDFDTVLSMAPNDATTLYALYNNRGVMRIEEKDRLSRRGQNEEAALKLALGLRDLQQAAQQCPSKYNAFASLADAYAQQKNWNEALRNIDLALANTDDPGTKATLYRYRARYHSESKDDSAALADLGKEIELESAA